MGSWFRIYTQITIYTHGRINIDLSSFILFIYELSLKKSRNDRRISFLFASAVRIRQGSFYVLRDAISSQFGFKIRVPYSVKNNSSKMSFLEKSYGEEADIASIERVTSRPALIRRHHEIHGLLLLVDENVNKTPFTGSVEEATDDEHCFDRKCNINNCCSPR